MQTTYLAVLATSAIVPLAVPRRYFYHFLAWLAIPIVLVGIELANLPHWTQQNVGYALGQAFIVPPLVVIGLSVGVRLIFSAIVFARQKENSTPKETGPGKALSILSKVELAILGCLAALIIVLIVRSLLQGLTPAWLAHTIAATVVAGLWIVPDLLPQPSPTRYMHKVFASFRWSVAAIILGFTLALTLVIQSADRVAKDQLYCIQVADGGHGYRPAETMLDLSGLTMRARRIGGSQQYHALLIVDEGAGRQVFNWSYRMTSFVPDPYFRRLPERWPAIVCDPQQGFAARLPVVIPKD